MAGPPSIGPPPPGWSGDAGVTRHWTINGRFLTQPVTGVQRYAVEIVRALDRALADGHPLARDLAVQLVVPPGARPLALDAIRVVRRGAVGGHAWEQLVLPVAVRGGLISLGNAGPVALRRHIVCMHDVNTRAFPASYSVPYRALQATLLPVLGRTACRVSTVSDYSAAQLVRHGICAPGKVVVAPNGHEHVRNWMPRHSAATRAAAGPGTIVMIGTPAPHKNIGLILGLADRLTAAGLRVAVVGERHEAVYRAAGLGARPEGVAWLGRVSDGEMAALLEDCLCLAFPSFVEGFGLPPLEAMAFGCPVVASDRASLPEICGDAALYAAPDRPDAWLDGFSRLAADADLRRVLADRGRARARRFSWATSARIYLEAMRAVDARLLSGAVRGAAPSRADVASPWPE